ncbi:F0F1 ATP synthase subunit delta [Jiella sonneratiae]|uniref:ATP synthase subunit b n=1 Tax=Jiella sonneratiae TaxID=2816856 RepID=A0ABS3J148_9HYPH|nr:F0F1 ATP synthase subunit delta [Jiella sonneratiae]MBO0903378.1 F0F1 ATP synthase subunit delta [Jiella sonneratiae]
MTLDWWTFGFQTVNVLILVWLLSRFFFKPLAAMIAARRQAAAAMLAEADAARRKAVDAAAAIETTRAGFAGERAGILDEARTEAEALRQEILAKAKAEAAKTESDAEAAIAGRVDAQRRAFEEEAARLAVDIAAKLLGRIRAPALSGAFLDALVEAVAGLPESERRAIAANGAHFTAVSPAPLDAEERTRCRDRLAQVLGRAPALDFATDPGLIAGLELKGEHLTVANSWRADLDAVRAELARSKDR